MCPSQFNVGRGRCPERVLRCAVIRRIKKWYDKIGGGCRRWWREILAMIFFRQGDIAPLVQAGNGGRFLGNSPESRKFRKHEPASCGSITTRLNSKSRVFRHMFFVARTRNHPILRFLSAMDSTQSVIYLARDVVRGGNRERQRPVSSVHNFPEGGGTSAGRSISPPHWESFKTSRTLEPTAHANGSLERLSMRRGKGN